MWEGISAYRVPEWDSGWRAAGSCWTYVTKDLFDTMPKQKEGLLAAIADGTAQPIYDYKDLFPGG